MKTYRILYKNNATCHDIIALLHNGRDWFIEPNEDQSYCSPEFDVTMAGLFMYISKRIKSGMHENL